MSKHMDDIGHVLGFIAALQRKGLERDEGNGVGMSDDFRDGAAAIG